MEAKLKHLEFIQNAITRMNTCSFLIKGWSTTLLAGLFALAAKDANVNYVLISYIAIPVFWVLDGFFVSTGRMYCDLYGHVSKKEKEKIDFSMDPSPYNVNRNTWIYGVFSKTTIPFYGVLIISTLVVMFAIKGK